MNFFKNKNEARKLDNERKRLENEKLSLANEEKRRQLGPSDSDKLIYSLFIAPQMQPDSAKTKKSDESYEERNYRSGNTGGGRGY